MSPLLSAARDAGAVMTTMSVSKSFVFEEAFVLCNAGGKKDHIVAARYRHADLFGGVVFGNDGE